jgi:uncharacterized membrane protein
LNNQSNEKRLNAGAVQETNVIMTIDEMIAVLQAAKAGKRIQINVSGKWTDLDANPSFGAPINSCRVKPEPREWWIEPNPSFYACNPPQRASSQSATLHYQAGPNYIHVREVID